MAALFPMILKHIELPEFLNQQRWDEQEALREILRGRLEGLGPIVATKIAFELGIKEAAVNAALIALEVEGFVFQDQFTPTTQTL
jgi:ATP-dependent Lhr-like helicase